MNDENINTLNALIERRHTLMKQRDMLNRSKFHENDSMKTKKRSLDSSGSIVENSDTEFEDETLSKRVAKRPKIIINSSSDIDDDNPFISTSTFCLPQSHKYFGAASPPNPAKKITIISDITLPTPDSPSLEILDLDSLDDIFTSKPTSELIIETAILEKKDCITPNINNDNKSKIEAQPDNSNIIISKAACEEFSNESRSLLDTCVFEHSTDNELQEALKPCKFNQESKDLVNGTKTFNEIKFSSEGCSYSKLMDTSIYEIGHTAFPNTSFSTRAVDNGETSQTQNNMTHENDVLKNLDVNIGDNNVMKRKCTQTFRSSCLDFISADEFDGDFSSGSSDIWSHKEDESDDSIEGENKTRKRKLKIKSKTSKKRKIEKAPVSIKKTKRENKKKVRKSLADKGMTYEMSSGKIKEARKIKDNPCVMGKCPRKCYEILEQRRKSLFDYFWSLNEQKKREWIVHNARVKAVKRKKTKSADSRRGKTYEYFINEGEARRQVCQQFLMNTLDITQTYILYTLSNANEANEGISQEDQRNRHAINKYDEKAYKFAKKYIEGLPVLPSHYCRKNSSKLYLPQEFNCVAHLYRLYQKYCESHSESYISERLFSNLFKSEYNISFHIPKKDKCKICTKQEHNTNKTEEDLEEIRNHNEEKQAGYQRAEIHRNLVTKGNVIMVASFDLQKVLNTPYGESMLLYYTRKYAFYNFTVYENGTQNGYCFTWGESDGKRGSCEIGTCLHKYLTEADNRGVKYLILYCDSCSGQNKNKVVLSVFTHFLETSKNLQVIQINYILPGHTYMSVDSMHSVIERQVRNLIVWSPTQWPSFMEAARKTAKPYQVNVLEHKEFIDWKKKADVVFTAKTLANKDLRLREIRIATFKKKDLTTMEVKYTMKEEGNAYQIPLSEKIEVTEKNEPKAGKGKGKGKGKGTGKGKPNLGTLDSACTLPALYKKRLPISEAKYKDLKKLCDQNIIPHRYQKDFLTLPYDNEVIDTLMELDAEENIEIDEILPLQEEENIEIDEMMALQEEEKKYSDFDDMMIDESVKEITFSVKEKRESKKIKRKKKETKKGESGKKKSND